MKKNIVLLFVLLFLAYVNFALYKSSFFYTQYLVYPNGAIDSNGLTKKDEKYVEYGKENNSEAKYFLFIPDKKKATHQAVIICPGGGYQYLVYRNEGINVAKWLKNNGILGVVLMYRMPNKKYYQIPLEDLQATIKIVRENSKKLNIDPNKVGVMGFSAGGHLASTASNNYDEKTRPDFSILYYPVISMRDKYTNQDSRYNQLDDNKKLYDFYSNELKVTPKTPPTYIAFSKDDTSVDPINSKIYYEALKKNNVPVEMHMYDTGGHGWGWSKKFVYHKEDTENLLKWLKSL